MNRIRLVIADDQPLFVEGVRRAVGRSGDMEVVGTASSAAQLPPLVGQANPDFVLMDFLTPNLAEGLASIERIKTRYPNVKIAVISGSRDAGTIETVLRRGACAFFPKSMSADDLAPVIRQVMNGTVFQALEQTVEAGPDEAAREAGLTEREHSIVQALARGLSNDGIAKELWITRETVKFHLHNIYRKFGVSNRTEAAMLAFERGLAARVRLPAILIGFATAGAVAAVALAYGAGGTVATTGGCVHANQPHRSSGDTKGGAYHNCKGKATLYVFIKGRFGDDSYVYALASGSTTGDHLTVTDPGCPATGKWHVWTEAFRKLTTDDSTTLTFKCKTSSPTVTLVP